MTKQITINKFRGAIRNNFKFERILRTNFENKFIQRVFAKLDDETINRIITSPKYQIGEVAFDGKNSDGEIEQNAFDLNCEFAYINSDKKYTINNKDYTSLGIKFFAFKTQTEQGPKIEICALYTLKTDFGISCGLYYLPRGNFDNICFISRICYHNGSNEHINSDGAVIGAYDIHKHTISEKFIKSIEKLYSKDPAKALAKAQSGEAVVLKSNVKSGVNTRIISDLAIKEYNLRAYDSDLQIVGIDGCMVDSFLEAINDLEGAI